jgi:hypothetical protein
VLMQGGRAAEEASSSSGSSSRRRCVAILLGLLSWGGIGAGRMLGQLLKVGLRQWGAGGEEEKRVLRVGVGFRKGGGTRVSGLGLTRVSGLVVPGRRRRAQIGFRSNVVFGQSRATHKLRTPAL